MLIMLINAQGHRDFQKRWTGQFSFIAVSSDVVYQQIGHAHSQTWDYSSFYVEQDFYIPYMVNRGRVCIYMNSEHTQQLWTSANYSSSLINY